MLCFVYSWVQGRGTRHHALDEMCLRGASDAVEKLSFKFKFSFCCFYIHCKWPSQEVKSRFHHVNLLASSLDQHFEQSHKIVGVQ